MTQTVKMNELVSPAALASQVLFQLTKILLFYSSIHELGPFPSSAFFTMQYTAWAKSFEVKLVYLGNE